MRIGGVIAAVVLSVPMMMAQSPVVSRGFQTLSVDQDECMRRAERALRVEGFSPVRRAADLTVGSAGAHQAHITCNRGEGWMMVNVFVASSSADQAVAMAVGQRLLTRMNEPSTGPEPAAGAPATSNGEWTPWMNIDDPAATGDWEGLDSHRANIPCERPSAVECRVRGSRVGWTEAGQRYKCSLEEPHPGGICFNNENGDGCLDYEVRFRCGGAAATAAEPAAPPLAASAPPACPGDFRDGSVTLVCSCSNTATASGAVWGSDIYTADSSVCRAAVHAGVIPASGGAIKIFPLPGRTSYGGSNRYGIAAENWGAFARSFSVGSPTAKAPVVTTRLPDCPGNFARLRGSEAPLNCFCSGSATQVGRVYGTNVYTDDSSVCRAALHAGVIPSTGGAVRVESAPGQASYVGSDRHEVASSGWHDYPGSFRVSPSP